MLMNKYELISLVGEGSYGIVAKCKNVENDQFVAIKKLVDIDGDDYIKKMALREIRILKKLRHENIVRLTDVFKRRRRYYLVFEYLDRTLLNELEKYPQGLNVEKCKQYMYQLIRAVDYCHMNGVIHRDIKPENLLVSSNGLLKLCDFGFSRYEAADDSWCTEYIATRWYRAPELLLRHRKYRNGVDIWAVGCVFAEILTGEPLFAGESDVDQLYQITKVLGKLPLYMESSANVVIGNKYENEEIESSGNESSIVNNIQALHKLYPEWPIGCLDIIASCLSLDPELRIKAPQLMQHEYFQQNNFANNMILSLRHKNYKCSSPERTPRLQSNRVTKTGKVKCYNFSNWNKRESIYKDGTKTVDNKVTNRYEETNFHKLTHINLQFDKMPWIEKSQYNIFSQKSKVAQNKKMYHHHPQINLPTLKGFVNN